MAGNKASRRAKTGDLHGERKMMVARFGVAALFLLGVVTLPNPAGDALGRWLVRATTAASTALMKIAGLPIVVTGDVIKLPKETLVVTLECTAIYLMIAYSALVAAYPSSSKNKLLGLMLGLPAIFVTNIVRLLVMAAVAYSSPNLFRQVHDYIWQVLFVAITLFFWVVWVELVVKDEGSPSLSH